MSHGETAAVLGENDGSRHIHEEDKVEGVVVSELEAARKELRRALSLHTLEVKKEDATCHKDDEEEDNNVPKQGVTRGRPRPYRSHSSSSLTVGELDFVEALLVQEEADPALVRRVSTHLANEHLFPLPAESTFGSEESSATSVTATGTMTMNSHHKLFKLKRPPLARRNSDLQHKLFVAHERSGVRPSLVLQRLHRSSTNTSSSNSSHSSHSSTNILGPPLGQRSKSDSAIKIDTPNKDNTTSTDEDDEHDEHDTCHEYIPPPPPFKESSPIREIPKKSPSEETNTEIKHVAVTNVEEELPLVGSEEEEPEIERRRKEFHHVRSASRMSQGFEVFELDDGDDSDDDDDEHDDDDNDNQDDDDNHDIPIPVTSQQGRQLRFLMSDSESNSALGGEPLQDQTIIRPIVGNDDVVDAGGKEGRMDSDRRIIKKMDSWDQQDVVGTGENVDDFHPDAWDVLREDYSWGAAAAAAAENDDEELNKTGSMLPFMILGTSAEDKACQPHVLSPPLMESIQGFLPEGLSEGCNFLLKYSLVRDGPGVLNLLRNCRASRPTVLAMETADGHVFGSFTNMPWRSQHPDWNRYYPHYYGSQESFVWRMRRSRQTPCHSILEQAFMESELEVYPYTERNDCVQYCRLDTIGLGGGGDFYPPGQTSSPPSSPPSTTATTAGVATNNQNDGGDGGGDSKNGGGSGGEQQRAEQNAAAGFAISLDSDLMSGTTSPSDTFGNPCLVDPTLREPGSYNQFDVVNLEVWTLTLCTTVEAATRDELDQLFFEQEKGKDKALNVLGVLFGSLR